MKPRLLALMAVGSLLVGLATADGEKWSFRGYAVGKQNGTETSGAWMAEVIRLDNGTYRMYYGTNLAAGLSGIKYAESTDGVTWTVRGTVLQGASDGTDPEFSVMGPSLLKLADGRYRMYYQSSPRQEAGRLPKLHVRSAISSDGVTFTKEGVRINIDSYDPSSPLRLAGQPSVFSASDGTIVAIFSGELHLTMAKSSDGLTFGNFTTLYRDWHDPIVLKTTTGFTMYATYRLEKHGKAFSPDGVTWPQAMTDVSFVDASNGTMTEANSGVGDIGGVVLPSGDFRLFTNHGNPSDNIVYFEAQTLPGSCQASISPASASVGSGAAGGSVTVTTNAGCTWTATSNAAYVTVTSGSSGNGSGTVSYSVAANSGAARSGTITIAGLTFTIDQAAAGPVTLTVAVNGLGTVSSSPPGITCGGDCTEAYAPGTSVTLVAAVSPGSVFAGWTGDADCSDGVVSMTTARACAASFVTLLGRAVSRGSVDLNGDGGADVFCYDANSGVWAMELSNRAGAFGRLAGTWTAAWQVFAGDFNGDRLTDFFLYSPAVGSWVKAISTGSGGFTYFSAIWSPGWTPLVMDLDGDGKSDVFIYNTATGAWFKCLSSGSGTGEFAYSAGMWSGGWELYPADFDGNGKADLFLYHRTGGTWFRATNDGGSGFTYYSEVWSGGWSILMGDFNGDGRSDVFLYSFTSGAYFVCLDTGLSFSYTSGAWAGGWSLAAGDFDADGRTDLLLYSPVNGMWFEAVSDGAGGFSYFTGVWSSDWQVATTDFNGDGRSDVLLYSPAAGTWFQAVNTALGAFSYGSGTWSGGLTVVSSATRLP